jgi:murein DD-endopeptidase MepM/ murein hydrolase activator NlpD
VQLADIYSIGLQSGLSQEQAQAAMAIAKTEAALNGEVGDNGQSFGPFQFYSGGQLKNFARDMGVPMAQAGHIASSQPDVAARWALNGYLGDALRAGARQGLSGAQLATYGQRYGQVSVSPERAGTNYSSLFGNGQAPPQTTSQPPSFDEALAAAKAPSSAQGMGGAGPLTMGSMQPASQPPSFDEALASAGGLRAPATAAARGGYVFPVQGYSGQVQDHWGAVKGGSDLFAPRGTPVDVMAPGKVTESGWDSVGGNSLLVQGDDGNQYYYAHFDSPSALKVGQRVNAGDYVAPVGDTGDAKGKGTHLHIGIGPEIKLGSDKYGGTGGDYDAVGLLQRTLSGGGGGGAQAQAPAQAPAQAQPPSFDDALAQSTAQPASPASSARVQPPSFDDALKESMSQAPPARTTGSSWTSVANQAPDAVSIFGLNPTNDAMNVSPQFFGGSAGVDPGMSSPPPPALVGGGWPV